jgi:hypothetical protein
MGAERYSLHRMGKAEISKMTALSKQTVEQRE